MVVEKNTVISIHYKMRSATGEILEETVDGYPIDYIHGGGKILIELESQLSGMREGDHRTVIIPDETRSDGSENGLSMEVRIEKIRLATEEELTYGLSIYQEQSNCGLPGCC